MIKVEFKITDNEGYSRLIEKEIKSIGEFEAFKEGVLAEIKTLEPVIKLTLNKINDENTQKTNGNADADHQYSGDIREQVQSLDL